jgi:hypothetical protein
MTSSSLAVTIALSMALLIARPAQADSVLDSVLANLTIQQTTDNKKVAQPALFQYVAKKDAPDVWVVNLGVKFNVLAAANADIAKYIQLGPSLDYQRNTAADKEQDAFKAGVTLDVQTGDVQDHPAAFISSTVNYARDGVKHISGLQAKSSATVGGKDHEKSWRYIWQPNAITDLFLVDFVYTPLLGVEYDHTFTANMESDKGYVVRGVPRLVTTAYLVPSVFDHRIELIADLTARRDLLGSRAAGWHRLVKLSANLYVYKDAAGIGLDYITGEDPDAKFVNQTLVQISLKVKR